MAISPLSEEENGFLSFCFDSRSDEDKLLKASLIFLFAGTMATFSSCQKRRKTPIQITSSSIDVEFVCDDIKKKNIQILFSTLAKGIPNPLKAYQLHAIGKEIEYLHPLALMENAPVVAVRSILYTGSSLIRSKVLSPWIDRLKKAQKKGKVIPYLPDFAKKMGKEEKKLSSLLEREKWEDFILYAFSSSR